MSSQSPSLEENSCIYVGRIRHRRFVPKKHNFSYPLFMLYLDLDELHTLFSKKWFCSLERFNLVSFRREDYLCPETESLKNAVIQQVKNSLGDSVDIHSVRALLHIRYLNVVFNPVVFYYCFDADNNPVAILSEITNTPWGERHSYVLPIEDKLSDDAIIKKNLSNKKYQYIFNKCFHVSPFNPMNMVYKWTFSLPSTYLQVHMENRLAPSKSQTNDLEQKHFDSTLLLERKDFNKEFGKTLIQYPFITVKVITGIYWQAFKLWLKQVPFYDNPKL